MTVTQVLGCGIEKGTKEYEVDENYEMELLPKQQIAIVVEKEKVPEIVELIKQELYTGHIGDGQDLYLRYYERDPGPHRGRRNRCSLKCRVT